MTDGATIRAWARETGREVPDSGRLSAALRAEYETAHAGMQPAGPGPGPGLVQPGPGAESDGEPLVQLPGPEAAAAPDSPAAAERPPAGPVSGKAGERARRRWWSRGGDEGQAAAGKAGGKAPAPRAQRPPRRRVSLETLGSLAWVGAARAVSALGGDYAPVQRMMMFEAPVAGLVIEDALRGSVADKVMQPVARLTEGGSDIGALVGVPVLTAILCKRPELYPQVKPMLLGLMRQWVITAGPQLRKMRQREEKFAAELSEMLGEFGPGFSLEGMLEAAFADSPAGFNPDEEEAIKRARKA